MKLILKSTITSKEIELNVTDIEDKKLYYHFKDTIPNDVDEGEYSYTLYDDNDTIVATGIARIGDYKTNNQVYNNTTKKERKQYNG